MYKEIQKDDIVRTLDKLKEEFRLALAGTVGDENAAKLVGAIEILPDVYDFLPFAEFLYTLGWNEYALFTYQGKGYIASHSVQGVKAAFAHIENLARYEVRHDRDICGAVVFDEPRRRRIEEFPADLPEYRGGRYVGAFDHEDGNYGFIVAQTAEGEFEEYLSRAGRTGFSPVKRTEMGGNTYVLMRNNAGRMIYAYYSPMARRAAVIGGCDNYTDIDCAGDGDVCGLTLWQGHPSAFSGGMGMGYFVRLADGSFFVIDGGLNNNGEEDDLMGELERQNVRPDGKIIIRCWLITHGHNDHYNTMRGFIANKADRVTVEHIVFAPTHNEYRRFSDTPRHWDIRTGVSGFAGCSFVKPYAGQTWKLPGCEVEVLFAAQDMFTNPFYVKSLNNASAVIRIHAAGQTILIPGDIEADSADIICACYGNYLRSDIVQIAHHGYHGASDEFYTLCAPKLVLFPIMEGYDLRWDDAEHNNYRWRRLPSVKEVVPSHRGSRTFELPYQFE